MRIAMLALLLSAFPALSAEVVLLGHVTEITLLPEGHARCPKACPAGSKAQSLEDVCVSNSCGCGEATVSVHQVVVGQVPTVTFIAPYRLGEWCTAIFPLSGELILVGTSNGESRWSPAELEPTGEVSFEVGPFEIIAGVRASDLPVTKGRSTVSALRKAAGL
jgi:hypothetical protein